MSCFKKIFGSQYAFNSQSSSQNSSQNSSQGSSQGALQETENVN